MIHFNEYRKEAVLTTQSFGAVTKKGIGFDLTHDKRREIEEYTIIRVQKFNFLTKKVVINCLKGLEQYEAEVNLDFLFTHCALETPDPNQEVNAILVQHVAHNLLAKDTAIFIVVMLLTYLCGLILGRMF